MTRKERIAAFDKLGAFISRHFQETHDPSETRLHEGLSALVETAHTYNNWFIPKFVNDAVKGCGAWLVESELEKITPSRMPENPRLVAVICAGNIPMVGFHDVLCVLLSGHRLLLKMSADDNILLPFFLKLLTHYEPRYEEAIRFSDARLAGFDAVIATGSNNSAAHFEHYFAKYPHIIRRNRTSVAILSGNETTDQLRLLGDDIFRYFGLGCRNVSKVIVPKGYSFNTLFESIVDYGFVVNNNKYGNNYDYNRAIYLLGGEKFLDNNFLMIKESKDLHSPVAVLFYEELEGNEIPEYLDSAKNELQCIVGDGYIPFGYSQEPVITDYADNIHTPDFLLHL